MCAIVESDMILLDGHDVTGEAPLVNRGCFDAAICP
jgi:hypothetical protein